MTRATRSKPISSVVPLQKPARIERRASGSGPMPTLGSRAVLARWIDSPDVVERVRSLPGASFAALVRAVGVEDAGEIVALGTTPQLVAAFDEDLFANERPGERETFDVDRLVTWLEVLLEAGAEVAAARFAELSEDFVIRALSSLLLVFDDEALLARLGERDRGARRAEKALESALTEEIDGYLLVARRHSGWDAALALIAALDRDHRALLARVLDRCSAMSSGYVDDLDALSEVLSDEESLAEDVESEREERRARAGFVEPRAAKAFLALAEQPIQGDLLRAPRDPLTRAYFRELAPSPKRPEPALSRDLPARLDRAAPRRPRARGSALAPSPVESLLAAMRALREEDPRRFDERMEELAYLANVLVAGAPGRDGSARLDPTEAAEEALLAVARGAMRVGPSALEALRLCHADVLFRAGRVGGSPKRRKKSEQ
ncbi:MAG: DUF6178 family protein [Polyangiaceae bacterium]